MNWWFFSDEKPRFTFANFLHLFIQGPHLTHSAMIRLGSDNEFLCCFCLCSYLCLYLYQSLSLSSSSGCCRLWRSLTWWANVGSIEANSCDLRTAESYIFTADRIEPFHFAGPSLIIANGIGPFHLCHSTVDHDISSYIIDDHDISSYMYYRRSPALIE